MKLNTIKAIGISLILSACTMNGLPQGYSQDTPSNVDDKVEKIFVGIPVLLGMEGSAVRLNDEWILTAAHNKPILKLSGKEVYYHPKCDVALYRAAESEYEGVSNTRIGYVYEGEEIFHVGYPITGLLSSHKGKYFVDVVTPDGCQYSATSAVVISGLSGGGVFNTQGELVGVTIGYQPEEIVWENSEKQLTSYTNPSIFISINYISGWIEEITGIEVGENYD